MKRVGPLLKYAAVVLAALLTPQLSQAGLIVNIVETGAGVQVSSADGGSIDLTGWSYRSEYYTQDRVSPGNGDVILSGGSTLMVGYQRLSSEVSGAPNYGPGTMQFGSVTDAGSPVGFLRSDYSGGALAVVFVPVSYVSGSALDSASAFYAGATFASLGMNVGSYTWTWNTGAQNEDFFTINVGQAPDGGSTSTLIGIGLVMLGAWRKRLG